MIDRAKEFTKRLEEINQSRSDFQLFHFVIGQHQTEPQRYRQLLMEINNAMTAYRQNEIQIKKLKIEIERLAKSEDPIDKLDLESKEIELENNSVHNLGLKRELDTLVNLYDSAPKHFTIEEIEADQEAYWQERLFGDVRRQRLAGGVQASYIQAIEQAGLFDKLIGEISSEITTGSKDEVRHLDS